MLSSTIDPRASRALLSVEAERARRNPFDGSIQVAVAVDDDRVLAAHLEDRPLDEDLARPRLGCALMDLEADRLRTGKRDEARLRMRHNRAAELRTLARAQVDDAIRQANLFEQAP